MENEWAEKIRIGLVKRKRTLTELAEFMEVSQPNLSKKLKRNNFSEDDIRKIAEFLDMRVEVSFVMEDGTKI